MTPIVTPSVDKTSGYEVKYQYKNGTLDPRLKLLLIAVRRALLILADAIQEYYNG